jgi:hypothetical protein
VNKRDTHKDVLGKVTIIRDISFAEPHRGHPIRNRLLRLTADSPDLLAIIKHEGKV